MGAPRMTVSGERCPGRSRQNGVSASRHQLLQASSTNTGSIAKLGEIAGKLHAIERKGILGAARLKALAEVQAILRNKSIGIDWEDGVTIPAGDLLLIVQMAMQRLG